MAERAFTDNERRQLKRVTAEEFIRRIVDAAPPLTEQQRNDLAALLAPTSEEHR